VSDSAGTLFPDLYRGCCALNSMVFELVFQSEIRGRLDFPKFGFNFIQISYILLNIGRTLADSSRMTLEKFRFDNKRPIRKAIHEAFEKADRLHEMEQDLIKTLKTIDSQRYFVWAGYKSLMGFCDHALRFSRTQSYRIVTLVRRSPENTDSQTVTSEIALRDDCKDREEESRPQWPSEKDAIKYGGPW
jgi:hypothetical protein